MSVKNISRIVLLLAASGSCAALAAPAAYGHRAAHGQQPDRILVDLIEAPPAGLTRIQEEGFFGPNSSPYRLIVEQQQNGDTTVVLHVAGSRVGTAILKSDRFPLLDLRALDVRAGSSSSDFEVIVSLQFGGERDCFTNDDGRDRIRLHFSPDDAPVLNWMTFRECEPVVTPIRSASDRP